VLQPAPRAGARAAAAVEVNAGSQSTIDSRHDSGVSEFSPLHGLPVQHGFRLSLGASGWPGYSAIEKPTTPLSCQKLRPPDQGRPRSILSGNAPSRTQTPGCCTGSCSGWKRR